MSILQGSTNKRRTELADGLPAPLPWQWLLFAGLCGTWSARYPESGLAALLLLTMVRVFTLKSLARPAHGLLMLFAAACMFIYTQHVSPPSHTMALKNAVLQNRVPYDATSGTGITDAPFLSAPSVTASEVDPTSISSLPDYMAEGRRVLFSGNVVELMPAPDQRLRIILDDVHVYPSESMDSMDSTDSTVLKASTDSTVNKSIRNPTDNTTVTAPQYPEKTPTPHSASDSFRTDDTPQKSSALQGKLVLTWNHALYRPAAGQRLQTKLRIKPVRGFLNPNTWDSGLWWRDKGVYWRAYCNAAQTPVTVSGKPEWMWSVREALRTNVITALSEQEELSRSTIENSFDAASGTAEKGHSSFHMDTVRGVALALLFGDKTFMDSQAMELLSLASLSHSLALSGMHLGLAAAMGVLLASFAGKVRPRIYLRISRQRLSVLLAAPFVCGYIWLGGGSPSLIRAGLMFAFWGLLLWRHKPRVLLDGLCAAVLCIVVHNPLALFDLRLQMSAGAIAALCVAIPALSHWHKRKQEIRNAMKTKTRSNDVQLPYDTQLPNDALLDDSKLSVSQGTIRFSSPVQPVQTGTVAKPPEETLLGCLLSRRQSRPLSCQLSCQLSRQASYWASYWASRLFSPLSTRSQNIRISGSMRKNAISILTYSAAIQLVLLPVTAWNFNTASGWFILNLLWLPVLGCVVLPLLFAGAALSLFPVLYSIFSAIHLLPILSESTLMVPAKLCFSIALYPVSALFTVLQAMHNAHLFTISILLRPAWQETTGYWLLIIAVAMLWRKLIEGAQQQHPMQRRGFIAPTIDSPPSAMPLLLLVIASLAIGYPHARRWMQQQHANTTMRVIDVGQGQSVLIELPRGKRLLVDGGGFSSHTFDVGKSIVTPVLTHNAPPRLDAVISSHPDTDHIRGLLFELQHFAIRRFACNGEEPGRWNNRRLAAALKDSGLIPEIWRSGDTIHLDEAHQLHVLHPPFLAHDVKTLSGALHNGTAFIPTYSQEQARLFPPLSGNNASLVLRLVRNGNGLALIPGDVDTDVLKTLLSIDALKGKKEDYPAVSENTLENDQNAETQRSDSTLLSPTIPARLPATTAETVISSSLKADVFILPHHGSRTGLLQAAYEAISPKVAVAATGYLNHWHFPDNSVSDSLTRRNIPLFATGEYGQLCLEWPAASMQKAATSARMLPSAPSRAESVLHAPKTISPDASLDTYQFCHN